MSKLALAFTALALVGGGATLPPGHSTIRLTAQLASKSRATHVGALSVTTMRLYNKSVRSRALGSGTLACTYLGHGGSLGPARSLCTASYTLPRGTLLAQGMTSHSSVFYVLVIVGGTGIYSSVGRGTVSASTIGSHLQLLIFALQSDAAP